MSAHRTQETPPQSQPTAPAQFLAPLSPHWAFVVQLRHGTPLKPDQMQGRIEHIVSGQATTFSSLDEARAFMEQVLTELREKPP